MTEVLTQLFIGGAWVDAADGATMPVDDPTTVDFLWHAADAGPKDARLAEEAAVQAQAEWARTAPRARSEILRRAHEIILERTDELAHLMTSEMGKPLAVELPAGHGHPKDRPGDRGGLHDDPQARAADPAVQPRAGRDPQGGGPAGRGA